MGYLRKCLSSIYERVNGLTFEVIVIDNASYDGSAQACAAEKSREILSIQAEQNLGFSRANNQAFSKSRGRAIHFLNPDTEIVDDAVMRMHMHLYSRSKIGAVGCRVLNSNLSPQLQYLQAFPNLWNQVLTSNLLWKLFPKSKLWGFAPLLRAMEQPCPVDIICGSCIMVKREVYQI